MYWSESFQIQLTVCLCFLSAVCKGKGQVSGRSMPLHFRYGQAARLMSWGDLWPQAHPCSHHGQYLWQQGLRPSLHNLYCHGHVICGSEGRSAPGWGKRMAGRLYSWLLLTWLTSPLGSPASARLIAMASISFIFHWKHERGSCTRPGSELEDEDMRSALGFPLRKGLRWALSTNILLKAREVRRFCSQGSIWRCLGTFSMVIIGGATSG